MSWSELVEKHGTDVPLSEDLPKCPYCGELAGYEKKCQIMGSVSIGLFEHLDAADIKDNASITAFLSCIYCRISVGMIVGNVVIVEDNVLQRERIRGKNVG